MSVLVWIFAVLLLGSLGCPEPDLVDPSPPKEKPTSDAGTSSMDLSQDAGHISIADAGPISSTTVDAGRPPHELDAGGQGSIDSQTDGGQAAEGQDGGSASLDLPYVWQDYFDTLQSDWLQTPPQCQDNDWLAKYLTYRKRFRGDDTAVEPGFTSIGLAQGQSLPASYRDPERDCVNSWSVAHAESCVANPLEEVRGVYKWGDGTVYLGYYIATLASEYKAFQIFGFDTAETVSDLYHAMMAFNRLDENAELPYGATPVRDGFFLRDDVHGDFWQLDDGGFRFERNDDYAAYGCMLSDYNCGAVSISGGDFISQDQAVGMVWGLSFVDHFLPDSEVFGAFGLRAEAKEMVHRIVNKLRNNDWKVLDPDGETPPAEWGGNAQGFSNQLAKAADRVCGNAFGVDGYSDNISNVTGAAAFAGINSLWGVQLWYNKGMALEMSAVTDTWDVDNMASKALDFNAPLYAYAHAVLNNLQMGDDVAEWLVSSALSSAPCSGPCVGVANCEQRHGWQGSDRWRNSVHRNGNRHVLAGEFNGLDYMFMHNLLVIYKEGHHAVTIPGHVPATCGSFVGLADLTLNGPTQNQTYDGYSECVANDEWRIYCGRPWALWLQDAYEGKATIFTGEGKWTCPKNEPCVISVQDENGTPGTDLFLGTGAVDVFDGQAGNDCIYGFGEADILEGNEGSDEIHGGFGNDEIYGERSGVNIYGAPDALFGGPGNDFLHGSIGRDALWGEEGFDVLEGGPDGDYLHGGEGNDTLKGEAGEDHLMGGEGADLLLGDSGDDALYGGEGNDKLNGESGNDYLYGDEGDDHLRGGSGDDRVWGFEGNDHLCGNEGDDDLIGHDGTDTCLGGGVIGGGTDTVDCEADADSDDCTESAFNDW